MLPLTRSRNRARFFGIPFSPSVLFEGGTVAGAWYDPSDLSTMFDTSAGTTPVAIPGQGAAVPVGAMLDKRASAYSVYFDGTGDYLSTSPNAGSFGSDPFTVEAWVYLTVNNVGSAHAVASNYLNSTTGWALQTSAGKMGFNASGDGSDIIGTTVLSTNTWYHIAVSGAAGSIKLFINGTQEGSTYTGAVNLNGTSLLSVGALIFLSNPVNTTTGYISNLRIVKGTAVYTGNFTPPTAPLSPISGTSLLTCGTTWSGNPAITTVGNTRVDGLNPFTASPVGNHAIAFNNTTARPELRARVNLLTYSEEFDNGAWTKSALNPFGSGSVANTTATLDPLGGNTADYIQEDTASSSHSAYWTLTSAVSAATYTYSIYVKSAGQNRWLRFNVGNNTNSWFNPDTGLWGTVAAGYTAGTPENVGNGWWRVSLTGVAGAATVYLTAGLATGNNNTTYLGTGSAGLYFWGADLRPANIGANVPAYQRIADALTYDTNGFPLYLRFDGIDDGMSMSLAVSTLNLSAFAGVRETGNSSNSNRYFFIGDATGNVNNLGGVINGQTAASSTIGYRHPENAPVTTVLGTQTSAVISYQRTSTTLQTARLNGIAATSNTNTTTTFTPATARIGCGVGSSANSSFFPGNIYSLIIAGSAVSAGNISATEQWVAGKTGISIFDAGPSFGLDFTAQSYQVWEF